MYVHVYWHRFGQWVSMVRWLLLPLLPLIWQIKAAHLSMIAMAPIGAMFTFIALVTGAI